MSFVVDLLKIYKEKSCYVIKDTVKKKTVEEEYKTTKDQHQEPNMNSFISIVYYNIFKDPKTCSPDQSPNVVYPY